MSSIRMSYPLSISLSPGFLNCAIFLISITSARRCRRHVDIVHVPRMRSARDNGYDVVDGILIRGRPIYFVC